MPKTDLSAWLTSPEPILNVVQKEDAKKKRGDGECQEGRNTRDKEGRKRKSQRREGGPEKKNTTGKKRAQAACTQSGRPGGQYYGNYAVLGGINLPPADISRSTENSAIWPAPIFPGLFMGLWGSIWSGASGLIGLSCLSSQFQSIMYKNIQSIQV